MLCLIVRFGKGIIASRAPSCMKEEEIFNMDLNLTVRADTHQCFIDEGVVALTKHPETEGAVLGNCIRFG